MFLRANKDRCPSPTRRSRGASTLWSWASSRASPLRARQSARRSVSRRLRTSRVRHGMFLGRGAEVLVAGGCLLDRGQYLAKNPGGWPGIQGLLWAGGPDACPAALRWR